MLLFFFRCVAVCWFEFAHASKSDFFFIFSSFKNFFKSVFLPHYIVLLVFGLLLVRLYISRTLELCKLSDLFKYERKTHKKTKREEEEKRRKNSRSSRSIEKTFTLCRVVDVSFVHSFYLVLLRQPSLYGSTFWINHHHRRRHSHR